MKREASDMKKKMLFSFLVAVFLITMSCSSENNVDNSSVTESKSISETEIQNVSVMIKIMDWTEENPLHEKAEIWFDGLGSWFIKPELKFGGTSKTVGGKELGTIYDMYLYPESRDGKEIMVKFKITEEMNPNGSPRDAISINFYDEKVEVIGLPVKAASDGKMEFIFDR